MKSALSLFVIVSLAGPSTLGPHPDASVAAPGLSPDAISRAASVIAREAGRSPRAPRAFVRADPPAAQQAPLTRGQRAAIGAVLGSAIGAILESTVGRNACDAPHCAVLGATYAGVFGGMIGWKYK